MSDTSREQLISRIMENMHAVKRSMHSQLPAMDSELPISRGQLELLLTIRHLQPISFKALAQHLYLTPGAISQQAEILEQQGYISRQMDPSDRRIQCLRVTETGDALIRSVHQHRQRFLEQAMQDLTDEELQVWDRIQQRLIARWQDNQTSKEK